MSQRILKRNLITIQDLDIGSGTSIQVRGDTTLILDKLELMFIFRTAAEIRACNYNLFTRVGLHVEDNKPLVEYFFNASDVSADDGDEILAPTPAIPVGRWLKVHSPLSYTTAELEDVTDVVNTSPAKHAGYMVWNSTTGKPVFADGSADADTWADATGATAHTPV